MDGHERHAQRSARQHHGKPLRVRNVCQEFRLANERIAGPVQEFLGDGRGRERSQFAFETTLRSLRNPVRGIRAALGARVANDFVVEAPVELTGLQRLGHDLRPDARGVAKRDPNPGTIWHV